MRPQPVIEPPSVDELSSLIVDDQNKDEAARNLARQKRARWLERRGLLEQVRKYRLITPLFGGGVVAGVNDAITPISGKAIRGHLRFWWRATRGGQFDDGDLERMRVREAEIWGGASTTAEPRPSLVQISIEIGESERGTEVYPYKVERRYHDGKPGFNRDGSPSLGPVADESVAPSYGSFPLQPATEDIKEVGKPTKSIRRGVAFSLKIVCPNRLKAEIEPALWAWETFGGLGARTRRGFGALGAAKALTNETQSGSLANTKDFVDWLNKGLQQNVVKGKWPKDVPHLLQDSVFEVCDIRPTAIEIWRHLITNLKDFRQQRNPGAQRNRPRRSKWPEPEQIRRLTKQRLARHRSDASLLSLEKFPRAALGLPIVFQFNPTDYNRHNPYDPASDPRKTMLRLDEHERLASPLILRPFAVSDKQFYGIALVLNGTGIPTKMKLTLQTAERNDDSIIQSGLKADLDSSEAALIRSSDSNEPLLGKGSDVLYGFLDFLEP